MKSRATGLIWAVVLAYAMPALAQQRNGLLIIADDQGRDLAAYARLA